MKTIAGSLLIFAALAAPIRAQDGVSPRPEGRVLLLQNERGLEGEVERVGDRYRVRRGTSEVWVPAEKALRLCADWNDAYEFMKKRVNLGDPDERLRLAKWCQLNSLRPQALAEAQAALEMRPAHIESGKLVTILKAASASANAYGASAPSKTAAVQLAKTSPNTKAVATSVDISSDAFGVFATRVQPILMNTCVNCHSGGRGGDFQLLVTDGSQRGITQANLTAVLDQLRMDNLVLSPLFIKAVSRHGNGAGAPIKDRQTVPFKTMQAWVEFLLTTNPHLRYRETDATASAPKKVESVGFAKNRSEPTTHAKQDASRRENAAGSPIPPPPVGGAPGEQQTQARSNDPFDPEPFNKQTQPRLTKRE